MPSSGTRIARSVQYFLTGFFIVAVVSSVVFIVYTIVPKEEAKPSIEGAKPPPPIEVQIPETMEHPSTPSVAPEHVFPRAYTVYIASYTTEPPAAEEVSRWNEAGYTASVVFANNHFRVALGRYTTVKEARRFAEQMWDAFENGYWIGRLQ